MNIYWIQNNRKCGPATVPDLLSLVKTDELTPDTLGWHAGCEGWKPLRELPALADFLRAPEPELPPIPEAGEATEEESAAAATVQTVYMPAPSCRLMARLIDVALFLLLVYAVMYFRKVPFSPDLMPSNLLLWLGFVALEALLLTVVGTTPGKAFFGIRLSSIETGQPTIPGFGRALQRSILVFIGGMGMMAPILPLLMGTWSWWQLRKHGITFWDARTGMVPTLKTPVGLGRMLIGLAVVIMVLDLVSVCMQPWMPDMVSFISSQSPEMGKMLQQMLPPA